MSIESRARIASGFLFAIMLSSLVISSAYGATTAPDAQSPLEQAQRAYADAWRAAPLSVSTATFATEPAAGYGQYTPRNSSVFALNEPLVVYLEPTGFGYGLDGDEYQIALDASMELHTLDGKVLTSTASPQRVGLKSRDKNREFKASLVYRFNGLATGDYLLRIILKDINSEKTAIVDLPFSIEEQSEPAR
ncbi:MAG: hypothetical protein ABJN26_10855 [Stappiaceae bacterium]